MPASNAASLFVAHGSPMFGIAAGDYGETLHAFATRIPRPSAIVIVSAHWEAPGPVRVNAAERPKLIYDFRGFPPALYELTYPAPGSPAIAEEALALLTDAGLEASREEHRGWDHGCGSRSPPLPSKRCALGRCFPAPARAVDRPAWLGARARCARGCPPPVESAGSSTTSASRVSTA